jgi:hypothetical protein
MKDKVISKTISLYDSLTAVHFQLHLPRDAKKITGVETDVSIVDTLPSPPGSYSTAPYFNGKHVFGLVSLKTAGTANYFYSDLVWDKDVNLVDWDFSARPNQWDYVVFSLASFRLETPVDIPGESGFIEGFYSDLISTRYSAGYLYKITVHIWYST